MIILFSNFILKMNIMENICNLVVVINFSLYNGNIRFYILYL